MLLSEEQLNNLNKEALVIIVASLQDQLSSMQSQLDTANRQLADTNRQIELLTEQIRIMNQRKFGRQSESNLIEGQLTLFDSFNEVELTADDTTSEPEISEVTIASYRRRKTVGKRDADLDGLPARVIDHRLPDEELARLFPHGYKELPDEIYRRLHIIHEDETPVKVMRIDNNKIKNGKKAYMWVYRNRPTKKARPIVLFDCQPSRPQRRCGWHDCSGSICHDYRNAPYR